MNYEAKYYEEMLRLERLLWTTIIIFVACMSMISVCVAFALTSPSNTVEPLSVMPEPITIEEIQEPLVRAYSAPVATEVPQVVEVVMEEVEIDEVHCFTSKAYINNKGIETLTSEIEINVSDLPLAEVFEKPEWDYKERYKDVKIIWEFLVVQQNVHPNIAAGIIGCIYHEGTFGEQQGSKEFIDSIEEARALLSEDAKSTGYGIAQWTYDDRRELLLKYYEEAFSIYPNDSYKASVTAELCCLVEELKGYNIFEDLSAVTSVEDATGRVAKLYECYRGSEDDWSKVSGSYKIASKDKSATKRLATAYDIYYHFMGD